MTRNGTTLVTIPLKPVPIMTQADGSVGVESYYLAIPAFQWYDSPGAGVWEYNASVSWDYYDVGGEFHDAFYLLVKERKILMIGTKR